MKSREEHLKQLQQQMYKDQVRLMNTNFVPYRGEVSPPMSTMTQNAIQMRKANASRPTPYTRKLERVIGRPVEGFSPTQINNLLNVIKGNGEYGRLSTKLLDNQFKKTYGYDASRLNKLEQKIATDNNNSAVLSGKNLKDISDKLALLEGKRAVHIAGAFNKAAKSKETRRENLIKQLEEFGNQEHAIGNLRNEAARDVFNEELLAPHKKIDRANEILKGINKDETHPDRVNVEKEILSKITNAYNLPHINYPGKRVVDIQPDTQESFDRLNRINPKYQDAFQQERKALERNFVKDKNIATRAQDRLPADIAPLMDHLDYLTKQQLKKTTKHISGKHVRLGTYGSGVHKTQLEKAMRDTLRKVQHEREGVVLSNLKSNMDNIKDSEINALNRYNAINELGEKEFNDLLKKNNDLNKQGWENYANKQAYENEALQNWQRQLNHEWGPMQRQPQGSVGGEGTSNSSNPFGNSAKVYGNNLSALFAKPQIYDETKKVANNYEQLRNKNILNRNDYLDMRQVPQIPVQQNPIAQAPQIPVQQNQIAQVPQIPVQQNPIAQAPQIPVQQNQIAQGQIPINQLTHRTPPELLPPFLESETGSTQKLTLETLSKYPSHRNFLNTYEQYMALPTEEERGRFLAHQPMHMTPAINYALNIMKLKQLQQKPR